MSINITARKFELTPAVKDYVTEKINHLMKFDDRIDNVHVVLTVDDGHHRHGKVCGCEIILNLPGKNLKVEEWGEIMNEAIDLAEMRAERILTEKHGNGPKRRGFSRLRAATRRVFGKS